MSERLCNRAPIVARTLQLTSVPRAMEKIAPTVDPSVPTSAGPPVAALLSDSKLSAPGTSAQNAASAITMAVGAVLSCAASIANGNTSAAPSAPAWAGDRNSSPNFCPSRATATAAISHTSDPRGADR